VISAAGVVSTIAGAPPPLEEGSFLDDAAGTLARFNRPSGVCLDPGAANLFVADTDNSRLRTISLANNNSVTTLAGGGAVGLVNGIGTVAMFDKLMACIAHPSQPLVFLTDSGNNAIRTVTLAGVTATLAGGNAGAPDWKDAVGTNALFNFPVVSRCHMLARSCSWQMLSPPPPPPPPHSPSPRLLPLRRCHPPSPLPFFRARIISFSRQGLALGIDTPTLPKLLFVADSGNHVLRSVDVMSGDTRTLVGIPFVSGFAEGYATTAQLSGPRGVAVSSAGRIYIADSRNGRVLSVRSSTPSALPRATALQSGTTSTTASASTSNTALVSVTSAESLSQGASPSQTATPSASPTSSRTPSTSPTATRSGTLTPSATPSVTRTKSGTPSETRTTSGTPSETRTACGTVSETRTTSGTPSETPTPTVTPFAQNDNSTYVLIDTTGVPGYNLAAASISGTTAFTLTANGAGQVAWVFLPNPSYGYRIVNVSFPARCPFCTAVIACDVYNADVGGGVTSVITTGMATVSVTDTAGYWTIALWPYVYTPPAAFAQPGYAVALRTTTGTAGNLLKLTTANPGINYGILTLTNVWTGATAGTFPTNAWNSVTNAGTVYAGPLLMEGVTIPSPTPTPTPTATLTEGASASSTHSGSATRAPFTPTGTPTATASFSALSSPTASATSSATSCGTATLSGTSSSEASAFSTLSGSATRTLLTLTSTSTATASGSALSSPTASATASATSCVTATLSGTASLSESAPPSSSGRASGSASGSPATNSAPPSSSSTASLTASAPPSASPPQTASALVGSPSAGDSPTAFVTTSLTTCGTATLSGTAPLSESAPPSSSGRASGSASGSPATNSAPPSSSSTASLTASAPPSASPPQTASTLEGSPSAGDSPTASASGAPSACASLSGAPSSTASRTNVVSATMQPGSESRLPSSSAARSASVSASPSLHPPSASDPASLSATLSPRESPTAGAATRTASPSGSSTASPSASSLPTGSAPATATATLTATPSKTPPRMSCLFRPGGCAQPALAPGWPLSPRGRVLAAEAGAPTAAFAAWPFFSATAVVTLPLPPALSEVATLLCAAAPAGLAVALGAGAPALAPCGGGGSGGGAPPAALCVVVPSQADTGAGAQGAVIPLTVTLPGGGALSLADAATARLSCELSSVFGATVLDARLFPRYGILTQLSLPLTVLPARQPLLASVALESRALAGTFRLMAGVGAGTVLPRLAPPGGNSSSGSGSDALWDSPSLGAPIGAPLLAPLLALLSPLQAAPAVAAAAPAYLAATLSSSAHLLLLLPAGEPLLSTAPPMVSLNGAPCAVNWVGGNGTIISVTTPPLAALCGGAGVPASGDCGTGVLVLREGGGDPLESLLAALRSASARPARRAQLGAAATLSLPSAYPPLPLPAAPAPLLAGLPLPELLVYARASAPVGAGFRLAEACADPAYAPAEECSLVGGRAPPPPAAGTVCAYGTGALCAPCPTDRAICPGGNVLLLKPGWWAPLATSPPSDAVPCPPPAAERCPGWAAGRQALGLCARGYTGAACGGCAKGFFPAQGSCQECPSLSNKLEYLALPAQFVGGLALLGLLLHVGARRALTAQRGGRAPPLCGTRGSGTAVGVLLMWAWGAAQTLSTLFSQTVADGAVPQPLVAAFAAFSALQFQGVAVAPACGEGGDPFAALWAATGAAYGAVAAGAVCVALLARAGAVTEKSPLALRAARALLAVCVAFFTIGYGALVGTAVAALACNAPAPLSVADYAATRGDGSLLVAALGASLGRALPNMTILRAAAGDPVFAATAGLVALLASPLPVPLLAADATVVCGEAAQSRARNVALALLALLAGALPCGALFTLFAAGKLKGLRRLYAGEDEGEEGGAAGAAAPEPPPLPPPPTASRAAAAAILAAALHRPELLPRSQWLIAHDWALTALCTGATAYAATATSLRAYLAYQLTMAVALLGSAALLWRLAPNSALYAWKNMVLVALYALAGAAACANVALRYALPAGGNGALALCATLLAATAGVLALLLALWWRSLSTGGRVEARGGREPRGAAAARGATLGRGGGAGLALRDAIVALPPPPAPLPPPLATPPDAEAAIPPPPPPPTTAVAAPLVVHTRNPLREGDAQAVLKLSLEAGCGDRARAPEVPPPPAPQPPQLALRRAAEAPLALGRHGAAAEEAEGAAPPAPPLVQREAFWWKTAAGGKKRGGQRRVTHLAQH
jgi:hypothetical protein